MSCRGGDIETAIDGWRRALDAPSGASGTATLEQAGEADTLVFIPEPAVERVGLLMGRSAGDFDPEKADVREVAFGRLDQAAADAVTVVTG